MQDKDCQAGTAPPAGSDQDKPDESGAEEDRSQPSPDGPRRRKKLSEVLAEIAADDSRERISVSDLMEETRLRASGALILLFALPNALPAPPGTSAILGLPLLYLCIQMALGRTPWPPKFIRDRSLARDDFVALLGRMGPILQRAERYLRPRLLPLTTRSAERLLGGFCAFLALLVALPIPLGNMLPALAISIIAIGMVERDGAWIIGGLCVGIASIILVWGVLVVLVKSTAYLLTQAFS